MDVRSNRSFVFASPPDAVWDAISDPRRFPGWWPWLRRFEGDRLAPGVVWQCEVKPPMPWTLGFELTIGEVEQGRRVTATVEGDIRGDAVIELAVPGAGDGGPAVPDADAGGCRLTLVSSLAPGRQILAAAAVVARPLVVAGHDWVIDTGARQFAERALGEAAPAEPDRNGAPAEAPGLDLRDPPGTRRKGRGRSSPRR